MMTRKYKTCAYFSVSKRCTCAWFTAYSDKYVKHPPITRLHQVWRTVGSGSKLQCNIAAVKVNRFTPAAFNCSGRMSIRTPHYRGNNSPVNSENVEEHNTFTMLGTSQHVYSKNTLCLIILKSIWLMVQVSQT